MNDYAFKFSVDDNEVDMPPGVWSEISVIQDCESILPTLRLDAYDNSGYMTHIMPFESATRVKLALGRPGGDGSPDQGDSSYNEIEWRMFRPKPESAGEYAMRYIYTGSLDAPALHSPVHCRAFKDLKTAINTIAGELEIGTEIDENLPTDLAPLQTSQTNGEFLNWIIPRLKGKKGEGGFKSFIRVIKGKAKLVVMSLEKLAKVRGSGKIFLGGVDDSMPSGMADQFISNYGLFLPAGLRQQDWGYYDDVNGVWMEETLDIKKFPSICQYLKIHTDDEKQSQAMLSLGRTNALDGFVKADKEAKPFLGAVRNELWNRLHHLDKMWVTLMGMPDIDCKIGTTVDVKWAQANATNNPLRFQNCGLWFVERSMQTYSKTWRTKLLLTRPGLNRDTKGKLVKAENLVAQMPG